MADNDNVTKLEPKATGSLVALLDTSKKNKHDLKTLPGAWIETRLMTYGEKCLKTDKSLQVTRNISSSADQDDKLLLEQLSYQANIIDIKTCVVNHNLTDFAGAKLDLSNPKVIDALHPKVGEEINRIIDEENNLDVDDLKAV